jgi:predicted TIM-barrel fold metal-dependent hydrolase
VLESLLADPTFSNLYFDISWDEVAKYVIASPESVRLVATLLERFPERFLFGSDVVGPATAGAWFTTYNLYAPLWAALSPETSAKVRVRNFERLFDAARRNVRAWEAAHPK